MSAPARPCSAIVVGHVDYGEKDRIIRLLTAEHGRVSALARGARGSTRRFAGASDLGNRVQAMLRPGRGELWHLQELALERGGETTRAELPRLLLMAWACELCAALAREQQPEPRLFGLLDMALLLIDAAERPPAAAFRAGLELKALSFAGLRPVLSHCAVCGEALGAGALAFAAERGGAAHLACAPGAPLATEGFLRALDRALRRPLRELLAEPLPPGPAGAPARMAEAFLQRPLRSLALLEAMGGPARLG